MEPRQRLIVSLDLEDVQEAKDMVDILAGEVEVFKVGISPFTAYGEEILKTLREAGKKVFLDLKVHDIPNTVSGAARQAARKNVFMMNFHCVGGTAMLEAAVKGAEQAAAEGAQKPLLLGVTVLTSMNEDEMKRTGFTGSLEERVLSLAFLAKKAGLNGVVASAKEVKLIKEKLGQDFVVVTPGVRPEWAEKGDQKRVLSPGQALAEGADYLVVGRPIIKAEDPAEAAQKIIAEMEEALRS